MVVLQADGSVMAGAGGGGQRGGRVQAPWGNVRTTLPDEGLGVDPIPEASRAREAGTPDRPGGD